MLRGIALATDSMSMMVRLAEGVRTNRPFLTLATPHAKTNSLPLTISRRGV
jgi:hypothetical protein